MLRYIFGRFFVTTMCATQLSFPKAEFHLFFFSSRRFQWPYCELSRNEKKVTYDYYFVDFHDCHRKCHLQQIQKCTTLPHKLAGCDDCRRMLNVSTPRYVGEQFPIFDCKINATDIFFKWVWKSYVEHTRDPINLITCLSGSQRQRHRGDAPLNLPLYFFRRFTNAMHLKNSNAPKT